MHNYDTLIININSQFNYLWDKWKLMLVYFWFFFMLNFLTGGRDNNIAEQGRRELVRGQHQWPHWVLPSHICANCCAFAIKTLWSWLDASLTLHTKYTNSIKNQTRLYNCGWASLRKTAVIYQSHIAIKFHRSG